MVIIDYFSRWPEVFFLKKTDASRVIKCMETAFNTHGLPHSLRTDNGPPFASHDFESFLSYLAVDHNKGIPYWPQSNGEVERFNETLLKIVRIAKLEKKDIKREVSNFLFQYRTTPHTVTGMTPAKLLGRELRDKLPSVNITTQNNDESDWQILLRERDARHKQHQKQYAHERRGAQNKLQTNYEPEPYKVIEKDGNAVVLQDAQGVTKMRSAGHMKKFVERDPPQRNPEPVVNEEVARDEMTIHDDSSTVDAQSAPPTPVKLSVDSPRVDRHRSAPRWMRDMLCSTNK